MIALCRLCLLYWQTLRACAQHAHRKTCLYLLKRRVIVRCTQTEVCRTASNVNEVGEEEKQVHNRTIVRSKWQIVWPVPMHYTS